MARIVARIRRLPAREDVQGRKLAADLAAREVGLTEELVAQLSPEAQRSRAAYLRDLRRQARDDDATLWPGGYDMFSRRQMEYVRKEIRSLPGKARRAEVYDAFLLLIGNIERDTGEILLSREDFARELGILPRHVSSVMGTLERLGVVRRERNGRMVTYFVDANVAWNGDLNLRRIEAAKSVPPSVKAGAEKSPSATRNLKLVKSEASEP